jgi:hypothetical protein
MSNDSFLNVDSGASGFNWGALAGTAVEFGVGYMFAQKEKEKNKDLLKKIAQLEKTQAEKLKQRLSEVSTEVAKTEVIIKFLNEQKIKELNVETKNKRILPLIVLSFSVVLLGLMFYKLSRKNG